MATLYKRGDRYYLNWRDDGVQVRRSLGAIDRKAAEALRAEKEAELRGLITPTRGVTVEAVLADYLEWYESARPTTYRRAASALKPLRSALGTYPAEGTPAKSFEAWGAAQASTGSAEKALKLARAAFKRAVRQRIITRSPMEGAHIPKGKTSRAPAHYRPEQVVALSKAPRGALWTFMAATGVRRGEMAKARRSDVRDGVLHVESEPEGRTKTLRWRAIPLNGAAKKALAKLGADRLVSAHPDTLSDWFSDDAKALGLSGSLHWLRHTFCSALVQSGVSLHEVKRLAGHSSVTVTERYAHHAPGYGREAVGTMDTWLRKHTKKHTASPKPRRPRSSAG